MYLHILYKDGSNPFFMLNATEKQIKKELKYQLSLPNKNNIACYSINGKQVTV